jgi:hypothetical protein
MSRLLAQQERPCVADACWQNPVLNVIGSEKSSTGVLDMTQMTTTILPSQAKPSQAKPSQAKPSQAKPSQAA